jgi:hypothetical protein
MKALTLTLLPIEVDPATLEDVTSRTITPQVVSAYISAAGDFVEAVSGCAAVTIFLTIYIYNAAAVCLTSCAARVHVGGQSQPGL